MTAAALAEREKALTEREREQFRRFLEKEYFTKSDFGALEGFYRTAYDRLSEEGKDAMSERIEAGIERGEFRREELPDVIREKEAQRPKFPAHAQEATPFMGSLKCELKDMPELDGVASKLTPPLSGTGRSGGGRTTP